MPRTKRTAKISDGGKAPRNGDSDTRATVEKQQETHDGFDPTAVYVRRTTLTAIKKPQGPTSLAPLADVSVHASQSSSAAAQLIETTEDEKKMMTDRWESDVHKQLDRKPAVPAVKSKDNVCLHSDCTAAVMRAKSWVALCADRAGLKQLSECVVEHAGKRTTQLT
ncbi:uncharacterized protein SCHCODRAFT_02491515 [Schizophyllum commune H4-8]|uniref:Uncharacterized protein n=1 Tax=Schizophyllum commune (strain H4-8 / FGSC 9210) TaxID=578458 RepID=D8PYI3_SCHCM|nr:uncharacterized protein SCHCODRAFT_02491515 [Schizophyllum commune H4-8]KAI5895976.1 hypothetical protein SCHCODRAFT_02491515 [Schizophyllum commune H4-8]